MSTFVKGLAWTVALLSGIATIFALFGGQQWLEQQGWTLAPGAAPTDAPVEQVTDTASDPTEQVTESAGAEQETADEGTSASAAAEPTLASRWASVRAWSDGVFANLLWGIVAVGVSMLLAGAAGALVAAAQYPISYLLAAFQWLLGIALLGVVVAVGFLLHGSDSGYLVWFIVLTGISAPLGFFVKDELA